MGFLPCASCGSLRPAVRGQRPCLGASPPTHFIPLDAFFDERIFGGRSTGLRLFPPVAFRPNATGASVAYPGFSDEGAGNPEESSPENQASEQTVDLLDFT